MTESFQRNDRHDPAMLEDYLSIQHRERYRFACNVLEPGNKVLDIACGTGYGTAMLRNHGCDVLGADLDGSVIAAATKRWKNATFKMADALNLDFADNSFDAVVTFETIEHVHDGKRFLAEMYRVLKPGGIFICSTPNIRYTAHPAYHVKEYEVKEFFSLVEIQFSHCRQYGQYFTYRDRLRDLWHWTARAPLIAITEAVGIKNALRKLLRRNARAGAAMSTVETARDMGGYEVIPIDGEKLLRIMVAVGRKGEN